MFTLTANRHDRPLSRIRLLLGISLVVVLVSALALPWAGAVPPGNNGTVKIDGDPSMTIRTTSHMSAASSRSTSTAMTKVTSAP